MPSVFISSRNHTHIFPRLFTHKSKDEAVGISPLPTHWLCGRTHNKTIPGAELNNSNCKECIIPLPITRKFRRIASTNQHVQHTGLILLAFCTCCMKPVKINISRWASFFPHLKHCTESKAYNLGIRLVFHTRPKRSVSGSRSNTCISAKKHFNRQLLM
jgi:hypothetical protein